MGIERNDKTSSLKWDVKIENVYKLNVRIARGFGNQNDLQILRFQMVNPGVKRVNLRTEWVYVGGEVVILVDVTEAFLISWKIHDLAEQKEHPKVRRRTFVIPIHFDECSSTKVLMSLIS